MNKVYPSSGWDCVMGVYESREDAEKYCAEYDGVPHDKWESFGRAKVRGMCVIHDKRLHRNKQMIRDNKIDEVLKP